jgi:hypothetical protein
LHKITQQNKTIFLFFVAAAATVVIIIIIIIAIIIIIIRIIDVAVTLQERLITRGSPGFGLFLPFCCYTDLFSFFFCGGPVLCLQFFDS